MFNEKFDIITTLLHPQNDDSKILANSENNKFIDDPIEIDFVQKKKFITNVVITKCKIKYLIILKITVNFNANFTIISKNIVK